MKKSLWLFVLSTLTLGMVFGCKNEQTSISSSSSTQTSSTISEDDGVTIKDEDFVVDSDYEADLGSTITIEQVTVKDSEKKYHRSTIKVTDPSGTEVTLSSDNSFVASKAGVYVVTHTITYGTNNAKTMSKSFNITVTDTSAPKLDEESKYRMENLVELGTTIDLTNIKISDNSGETITPKFTVKFNEEIVDVQDNKFVADKKGCYEIIVDATDSSNNKSDLTIKIFTIVDGENGKTLTNKFQGGVSLGDKGYNGNHSSNYHWTSEHSEWVNGNALLAEDCGILSESKYLSFWYYYDVKDYDARVTSISKYVYYDTKAFDAYGNALNEYWQFPNSYELENNTWYRFVLDLTNATNVGADGGQCFNNPTNLEDVMFGFGFWDWKVSANVSIANDIYIDDIQLTSELPSDYHLPPVASTIELNETSITLEEADTFSLSAVVGPSDVLNKSVSWESSDSNVATVSTSGEVTAIKKGTATITATSVSNPSLKATCEVTVTSSTTTEKKPDNTKAVTIDHQFDIHGKQAENLGAFVTDKTDLVDFGVGHGMADNYSLMAYNTSAGLCGIENPELNGSGEPTQNAVYQTWRFFYTDTDGIIYVAKAKKECFIKLAENASPAGWLEGTMKYIVEKEDGTQTVIETREVSTGTVACEYIHLEAGDTFIWSINSYGGMRNMQNSPDIVVAPVYEG